MESNRVVFKNYINSLKLLRQEVEDSNLEETNKAYYIEQIENQEREIDRICLEDYLSLINIKKLKRNISSLQNGIFARINDRSEPVIKSISLTSAFKTAIVDLLAGFGLLHKD